MRSCREIRYADLITGYHHRKFARFVATLWECVFAQGRQSAASPTEPPFALRTSADPKALAPAVRQTVRESVKDVPVFRITRSPTKWMRPSFPSASSRCYLLI